MGRQRLCIWDWNGTIQDDLHYIYECGVQRIFREFGLRCPTIDEYRNEVAANFMPFYHAHGIPADVTADALNAIMAEGFKAKGAPPGIFPDALAAVQALEARGYVQVLASGYATAKLTAAIERNGFTPYFKKVVGDVKDKPAVFAALRQEFSGEGDLVAAVGDVDEDAVAAASIDAVPIICARGFHTLERITAARPKAPTMVVVESLEQILDILP